VTLTPSSTDPCAWIEHAAATRPQAPFLTAPAGGPEITYGRLHAESARLAAALRGCGVVAGDRVLMQVEKSADAILLYTACLYAGAVAVPLNTAYTAAELEHFFGDAGPRLALVRPKDLAVLAPLAAAAGCPRVETLDAEGHGSWPQLLQGVDAPAEGRTVFGPDAVAALIYTSGTTGRSKGAMLTRGNLASNAAALAQFWRFSGDDVLLHTLPLFHVHGLFAAINTVLAAGASLRLLAKFDAAEVIAQLPQASVYMGVPTHYTRLLQDQALNRGTAGHVRLFVSGSAPLLAETHREFAARTGQSILERYGMTETLMNTSNPYDGARVPGSVGVPLPGIELRVTGAASADGGGSGAEGPAPAVGMLEIRGPNVCAGYWRDAAKTREAFTADGFFITGDLGTIDAGGYVHIVGRAKDLVISGGYNVYPKEIETELDALPGVFESAVIGVPHPDLGEGVTAVVVARPGAALDEGELIAALRTRLARYKVPRRILFVAALPRNAMGKVQKAELRTTHAALYRPA
jgi:malonyl-CoA/methylmalonyl-CoA synthetase